MGRALRKTAGYWGPLEKAYAWVEKLAAVLRNEEELKAGEVKKKFAAVTRALRRKLPQMGVHQRALGHLLKVTKSYGKGLFACYSVEGLPRTNNDVEHLFGAYRHHERRIHGHKVGSATMVVRGSVRLVVLEAARRKTFEASELAPRDLALWHKKRRELEARNLPRVLSRRFRHDPARYLDKLEAVIKAAQPP